MSKHSKKNGVSVSASEHPLKIGIVCDDTLDKTDGVAQHVLTTGLWLSDQGHEVHYLVGETKRTDLPNLHSLSKNVNVRFNGNRLTMPLPANKRHIRELLAREQFDVIYVQMPYSPALAARIVRAAGPQTAVVGAFHILPNNKMADWGTSLLGWLLRRNLQRFDAFLSVSTAAQAFSKRTFKIDSKFIPNASPLKPFLTAKPFPQYKDKLVVLCHGRLVERKGCRHFLEAVARLREDGRWPKDAVVLVSGKGPLLGKLQQLVAEHGLEDVVTFLGFISEEDKPRYMASADVVVYPSTGGESFGIVLIEAMAASRGAVLAGDNPGYASVMQPRPDSLFSPFDHAAFAAKLHKYLSGQKVRQQARTWQQEYVQRYDVSVVGEELLKLFRQALRKRRS